MKGNISRVMLVVLSMVCAMGVVVVIVMATCDRDGDVDNGIVVVEERVKTQAEIDNEDENIPTVISVVDFAIDIRDPEIMMEEAEDVALVRIDEISGFGNYDEVTGMYTVPYTYGEMTVLENYKGDLLAGEAVKFYRNGGILMAEEYYAGLGEELKQKYGETDADDPELWTKKTRYTTNEDIKLELGKTYLAYMVPRGGEDGAYVIICAQGGLREARSGMDEEWAEVLNNFTGEWERLSDVVAK